MVHALKGVGENLMDHILPKRSYTTTSRATFNAMMSSKLSQALAGLRYMTMKTGPLSVGAALAGGFACTEPGLHDPDIQLFYMPFEADSYSGQLAQGSCFRLSFYQNRPESRGHVRIRSNDPFEAPRISPNYYSSPKDINTAIAGMRLLGRIGAAEPLRKMGAVEVEPGLAEETDAALLDYIKANASTGYHHVGTCRMGSSEDENAVVDPQLRVRGIDKLRIADGSIMPTIPSGNTNAVCIMIGEKCADMIRRAA
jgi:choline dehydrogenase